MNKKRNLIIACSLVTLLISLIPGLAACGTSAKDLELNPDNVRLTSVHGSEHTVYPGCNMFLSVDCENTEKRPEKPLYLWTISLNDAVIKEIVIDENSEIEKIESTSYEDEDEKPDVEYMKNHTSIIYTCSETGRYTITVELFDQEEYVQNKEKADARASYTFNVRTEPIRVSITAKPTENNFEYEFQANIENYEYLQYYLEPEWAFFQQASGIQDYGPTTVLTTREEIYDGTQAAVHRFDNFGQYRINFKIVRDTFVVADVDTTITITSDFQIILPGGPYKTGQEYTFHVRSDTHDDLPDDVYYVWDFGDGPELTIPFNNECTHVFEDAGPYAIHVGVFEPGDAADMPIGSAIATLEVEAVTSYLNDIHKMKKIHFVFYVTSTLNTGQIIRNIFSPPIENFDLIWDGADFHMEWDNWYNHTGSLSGHVSEDGRVLEKLVMRNDFAAEKGENQWSEIEIANLPFWEDPMPDRFSVDVFKADVGNYVVSYSDFRIVSYVWDDDAFLQIRISEEYP